MTNLMEILQQCGHSEKITGMINNLFHDHDIPRMFKNHDIIGFMAEVKAIEDEYQKMLKANEKD